MNEIKKCSISGIAFSFEIEAYARLEEYIKSLKKAYAGNPDCGEIIADIEARIAELILSAQSFPTQTVGLPLIENIINQLGSAEDIADEELASEPTAETSESRIPRRLYRDTDNARLGGVCAGIGRYFNIDSAIVRLLFFVPLLVVLFINNGSWVSITASNLFALFIVTYVIMWFAVPAARSARQKLEMEGNPVTAKTIADRQTATPEQHAQSIIASFVAVLGRTAVVLLKVFVALLIFPLIVAFFALAFSMLCIPLGISAEFIQIGNLGSLTAFASEFGYAVTMLGLGVVLVPIAILIYLFIVLIRGRRPRWWVLISAFIVWLLLIFGIMFAGIKSLSHLPENEVERILKSDWDDIEESLERSAAGFGTPIDSVEYSKLIHATDAASIDK